MGRLRVIDVSVHNGVINWEQVKGNIDGAILRCGYGDDIASQDDKQWKRNLTECERLGIPHGAYLYSYANNDAHAQSELQHLLRLLKGHTFQLPIYLDCEQAGTEAYAPKACQIVCDGLRAAGYIPGVYANLYWWNNYLTGVTKYRRWVAQYNSRCDYKGEYDIWQYSSSGSIPGIPGRVDMNWCYKAFSEIMGGGNTGAGSTTGISQGATDSSGSGDAGIIFTYAVQPVGGSVLPEVNNLSDYAGIIGRSIANIAIKVNEGSVKYRVHILGGGWLPYVTGYDWSDANNGYAGNGKAIDAIEVYYSTPDHTVRRYGYQKAQYRVSPVKKAYYPWQYDNETWNRQDGYAGMFGVAIDRFQLFAGK